MSGGGASTSACSATGGGTPTSCSGAGTGTPTAAPAAAPTAAPVTARRYSRRCTRRLTPATLVAVRGRPTSASAVSGENRDKLAPDQLNEPGTAAQTRAALREVNRLSFFMTFSQSCGPVPMMNRQQPCLGAHRIDCSTTEVTPNCCGAKSRQCANYS